MPKMPYEQTEPNQKGVCDCGQPSLPQSHMCLECRELGGKRTFAIGQKVRITRRETWQGDICTITQKSKDNPNMYWLREHGWRRSNEIEPVGKEEDTMAQFSSGDKVIKRTEKNPANYGFVEDQYAWPSRNGRIAVRFWRMVWIKPENLLPYTEWEKSHQQKKKTPSTTKEVKNYWVQ